MEFKSLFERLRPEVRAKLEDGATKCPHSVGSVIETLRSSYSYLELSYDTLSIIFLHGTSIISPKFSDVSDLFED